MNLLSITPEELNDLGLTAYGVRVKKKFVEGLKPELREQSVDNRTGLKTWTVGCTTGVDGRIYKINIQLFGDEEPVVHTGPIRFGGLEANMYEANNGSTGVSFRADTFTQDPAPSTKRNGAKAEPPVPAGAK